MSFSFRPATRESVGLLIGLAGSSGSGKTNSALRIATGLAGGERFALIDTEAGRAKHYAGEFSFDHGDLEPPFRPDAYVAAIEAADKAGYPVIVVDSASHEHAGTGGLLDWHEEELTRMAGDDWRRREAMTFAAWVKPKMAHKAFVSRLLQIRAHLILCFRAEEKIEIIKQDGKTKVIPKRTLTGLDGWVPVCEKNLPYELTLSFLLTADAPGIPKPIKLQEQHRAFVPLDKPLSEETGRHLAEWARGDEIGPNSNGPKRRAVEPATPHPEEAAVSSGAPDEPGFNAPSDVQDEHAVAAEAAAAVEIPRGENRGKQLRELLGAGEKGERWLRWALRNWADDDFGRACWDFARVYMPELYEQVKNESDAGVPA